MKIETIHVAGLSAAVQAVRLPRQGVIKSFTSSEIQSEKDKIAVFCAKETAFVDPADLHLMTRLIKASDPEAKVMRGMVVWAKITAPIDFWVELETYKAGRERLCSESTMNQEGKNLRGKALREALNKISYGREITKVDMLSYQCLRNIFIWRRKHRKAEWWDFCNWIKTLPLADDLILPGLDTTVASEDDE